MDGPSCPLGTPEEIVQRLNRELVAIINTPEVSDQLLRGGMEPMPSTPDELTERISKEVGAFQALVEKAQLKIE